MQALTVNIDDAMLHQLAAEIVRNIYPVEELLRRFTLTPQQFQHYIRNNRRFIACLAEAQINWDSSLNTRERIRVKGDTVVEQMMVKAYEYYTDERQPLAARAKLLETVAKISGVYDDSRGPGTLVGSDVNKPSDRVSIVINLHPHGGPGATALVIDQPQPVLPASDPQ